MGARTLLSGFVLSALWCTVSSADGPMVVCVPAPPPPGVPPTCDRFVPLPPHNAGCTIFNLPATGKDDPWRPPKVWPQTKYPVVPSYTRPSYGYYETSWRVLCVGGTAPAPVQASLGVAPPPVPNAYAVQPTPAPAVTPRPTPPQVTPPQAQPQVQPPQATQPAPTIQGPQTVVPPPGQQPQFGPTQTGPPKATPPVYPLKPRRPQTVAPAPGPQVNPPPAGKQGANLFDVPSRTANETTDNDKFEMPDIAVKPF
jgi:hypothetical protein